MNRLVLGSGPIGSSLVERLVDRPGRLVVLVEDDQRAKALREEGTDARHVDLSDVDSIRTVAGKIDSVVVAPAGPERTAAVARVASEAYPDALVLACLGPGVTDDERARVDEYADRVVAATDETTAFLVDRAGDAGVRARKLQRVLRGIEGTLAVVAHDNPDPDAIASAVGLGRIAAASGLESEVCYYGDINHQENRALVNLLEYELRNLTPDDDLSAFGGFALVDHSRPGINDGLPESTPIDVVVDHHPPRAPIEARFVDLRSGIGATSTIVMGYLQQLGVVPSPELATGLLYGIQTDTRDFSREVSTADFEAASQLVDRVDSGAIQRIESPSVAAETLETLAAAVSNRRVEDDVLTSCVGEVTTRDALPQAADKLLEMDGVSTTLVFGYTDDAVFVSARSRGTDIDLGEVLREAFGQIGSAGGHADLAGAQIPAGILLEDIGDGDRGEVIEDVVTDRFVEALGVEPDVAAARVYADFLGTDDSVE